MNGADLLRQRARDHEQRQRAGGGESEVPDVIKSIRPPVPRDPEWAPPVAMQHPLRGDRWFVHPSSLEASMHNMRVYRALKRGKTMPLKFAGKCVHCKKRFPAGTEVRWLGPGNGVRCVKPCSL